MISKNKQWAKDAVNISLLIYYLHSDIQAETQRCGYFDKEIYHFMNFLKMYIYI